MPKFIDPDDLYNGYTSEVIIPDTSGDNQRGVFQVELITGSVDLQVRVEEAAPWFTIKSYAASGMDEVVLAPYFRVVATEEAHAWLVATK